MLNWSIIQIGTFGILGAVTAMVASWLGGRADKRYGPKPVISVSIVLLIVVCLVIVGMTRENVWGIAMDPASTTPDILFYICGGLIGAAGGPVLGPLGQQHLQQCCQFGRQVRAQRAQVGRHCVGDLIHQGRQRIALERQLSAYARDYGNFVELNAALKFTNEQLKVDAIDVEQIVLGRAPAVVLRDGAMLFEGGSYNGLTISSIDSNKVVFQGVATYEVPL